MIGWVVFEGRAEVHRVLCWYRYAENSPYRYVISTMGRAAASSSVTPLDTEAEVAALLLQGYKLVAPEPHDLENAIWHIRGGMY